MRRVRVGDGWFNPDESEAYYQHCRNPDGTILYKTRRGKWILGDSRDGYQELYEEVAYAWLIEHGYRHAVPTQKLAELEL